MLRNFRYTSTKSWIRPCIPYFIIIVIIISVYRVYRKTSKPAMGQTRAVHSALFFFVWVLFSFYCTCLWPWCKSLYIYSNKRVIGFLQPCSYLSALVCINPISTRRGGGIPPPSWFFPYNCRRCPLFTMKLGDF